MRKHEVSDDVMRAESDMRKHEVSDDVMRAEIARRFRRPKAQRMLKLAKKAQARGDSEVAQMWIKRALQ